MGYGQALRARVTVPLPGRAYQIEIGPGLLAEAGSYCRDLFARERLFVVTDESVDALHGARLRSSLSEAGYSVSTFCVAPGEGSKSWTGLTQVVEWLIAERVERDDIVVAFGGGVVGDLAGFAAAILRRGVRYVQIPTTLLAQVDSSIGGKTAINSPHGKNLIGAFHQPSLVLADTALLGSLSPRQFRAGYAEVAKYGVLGDARFFSWLETHGPSLTADADAQVRAVRRSCEMKAAIVTEDETEAGSRALLNYGHTFGHALEAATGFGDRLLHGEAVSIGMVLAAEFSARQQLIPERVVNRLSAHLRMMGLPTRVADIPGYRPDADRLMALMVQDKKVADGVLTLILIRGIGEAFVSKGVDAAAIHGFLNERVAEAA